MDIKTVTAITEFIIKFAKYYNLAESDGTSTTALVVSFQYLNRRLKFCMQKEYSEMLKHYSELFDFLMKRRQNVYDKKLDTKWTYRIIHGKNLLVFYQEPTMLEYYGIKEEYYTLIEKLAKGPGIPNWILLTVTSIWVSVFLQVKLKKDALLCDTQNWSNTLYDPHYLAQCLRKTGMQATLPIPVAKRTQFTEPKSGLKCFIGVDDGLVFERDILITEYLMLDKRVKPLIIAILRLFRSQRINKSCCLSTLSTTSYILMTLHFLMNVLENPVIPNLQNLGVAVAALMEIYKSMKQSQGEGSKVSLYPNNEEDDDDE
ncbi:hypothetical protein MFLAVUS_010934 [Mucor flavus]|uniref:Uncharacterized protein n=1 Tax=Mucor flavus TaxID=439312 RepID=A0ABP9ZEC3_9FUNG